MRYTGNYRLMDNPRAKHSHQLRAMMKRRERLALPFSGKRPTTGNGKSSAAASMREEVAR